MSRYSSLEERRNRRKAVLWSLAGILVIVAVVFGGIPVLGKLAEGINNLKSNGKPIDKNDLIAPVSPVISLAYDATNSANQAISGLAEPYSMVYLTRNNDPVGQVKAGNDGSFEVVSVKLVDGRNTFTAVAIDEAGNKSSPANSVVMIYSNKGPEIKLDSPVENQHVNGNPPKVQISGSVDPSARLLINDRVIIVSAQGKFNINFQLNNGDNLLIITATDAAGNQTKKELTVTAN